MLFHGIFENKQRYFQLFKSRIFLLQLFVFICFFILLTRLVFLQIINHQHYNDLSYNNRVNTYPIAPTRGIILDRENKPLAINKSSYNLAIIPERSNDLHKTVADLSEFITIEQEEQDLFFKEVKRKRKFDEVPLKLNLSHLELERFASQNYRFPEVIINADLKRYYPENKYFAHILGYLSRINDKEIQNLDEKNYAATNYIGKIGIEKSYENILHGTSGEEKDEVNAYGRKINKIGETSVVNGNNIKLTIDSRLQKFAYESLKNKAGSIVAISPKTGEILAMVSVPAFDPNLFISRLSFDDYKKLQDAEDKPLFNRSVRGRYPPASTIKPIMVLQGLELNLINKNYSIYDQGFYKLKNDNHLYRDWKSWGHGWTDYHKAIVESCDTFFYDLAFKLKIKNIESILTQFGLGDYTKIDINEELPGLVPNPEWKRINKKQFWFPGETLITGIGQGFLLATPLQMSVMTSILANQGTYYQPHLVKAIKNNNGEWIETKTNILNQVKISENNWKLVNKALTDVIASPRGTAHRISGNLNYSIAGKTGTAQVFSVAQGKRYRSEEINEKLRDHGLFIGYAPADDPEIAIATIIENGADGDLHTSSISRAIMDKYFELKLDSRLRGNDAK